MKPCGTISLIAFSTVLPCGSAIQLQRNRRSSPRVLQLGLSRNQINGQEIESNDKRKRQGDTVNTTLTNVRTLYYFNATLGTPGQPVALHLDTGSSDLWVNTQQSRFCSSSQDPCGSDTYDANSSSSYDYLNSAFSISYADGSGAAGDFATDTLRFSGEQVRDFQFGIGYRSSAAQNIAGIGYTSNESPVIHGTGEEYKNLPARMVDDGLISSPAYSLWLNDLDASSGTILFGGVDEAKFNGDLVSLPIQQEGGEFRQFFITMTGLEYDSRVLEDNLGVAVLLDSGSSLTYLPNRLTAQVYSEVNAAFSQSDGVGFVPCSLANQDRNLTFRFSEPASITVPLNELVLSVVNTTDQGISLSDTEPICLFGIAPSGSSTNVLGDTFLRSAYVVYDLDNNEISLAQTIFNATGSRVVEIGTGDNAVPGATDASETASATSGVPSGEAPAMVSPHQKGTLCVAALSFLAGFVVFLA